MEAIVRIENALCRIGRDNVLQVDSFQILQGEHWCLYGPNGAGKSLLANLLAGKRPESLNYVSYWDGFEPARDIHIVSFEEQQRLWLRDNRLDISEYRSDAQDTGTVAINLIQSSRPANQQDPNLLNKLLDTLGLVEFSAKGIRYLSSGQIRKVLLARALYSRQEGLPQLLILDDPLESIDRESQQRIVDCIEQFSHAGFSSLQLCRRSSHILPGVTHLAVIDKLRLLAQGKRSQVESVDDFCRVQAKKPKLPVNIPECPDLEEALTANSQPLIQLDGVDAGYGEMKVLNDINWRMEADHHVLIEGPNGCGKSTLLSLIDGENHKGYGQQVFLFGRRKGSGETIWEVKAQFGIISNELHNKYVKGWRVIDVVVSGFFDSIGLYDDSGASEKVVAKEWLSALGISDFERHFYNEISFGQQRLVLLARAMVKHPRVLILDEPCVGLDDYHRELILGMLDLIAVQANTQIVYVSHVVGERPTCINQRLGFEKCKTGGFTLTQVTA
ncbi:MAG TPA: ABC transporter ATP-binding protein [Gammaproteobacteria bacterium]|nr:ATP-binding cassette domain-containing protein [Pseudomonadales bacterium]HAI15675.1 ABC transporter ATP-binding protein [Gammaproteobacteria bacterium]HBY00895.1 ABC transporter ATP-binding protein [Gammaproteobacteria bacterium]|tara:strand:- start:3923 stop:5428 length:1506 start_codon:yes stop_codon:yes gene_type:complete